MSRTNSASVAKVTLKLANANQEAASQFFKAWQNAPGIVFLKIELKNQKVLVHYDATMVSLDTLLQGLAGFGLTLKTGLLQKWRLDLARQVEQNIQDNINHVPHCCGKAPAKVKGNNKKVV